MADPQAPKSSQIEPVMRSPSGADLVLLLLLVLFGFGIWALVERGVAEALRSREPHEQKIMEAHGVIKLRAELTELQNEIADTEKYLNAARLDLAKQSATAESFLIIYSAGIPTETVNAYHEARRQEQAATTVVKSLEQRVADLKSKANTLNADLKSHQESAESEFHWARLRYTVIKRTATFVITLVLVMILLWLARVALWRLAHKRRMSTVEGFRPFELALAMLVVLFAYDQFSFAGAALAGILLLLLLLRRINWPRRSDLLAK